MASNRNKFLKVGERAEILAWKLKSGKLNLNLPLSLYLTLHGLSVVSHAE